jgi:O-antigen/teichoic acid export membrane protein
MIKGLGQQTACVRYNILTSSLDVLLLYLLLPAYGMEGYFFSFLVTHLLNFFLSVRRLIKLTGKIIPISTVVFTLLATAGSIIMSSFVSIPVLRGGAYVLLLGCILYLFQVIGQEDLSWLKGLIKRKGSQM